MGEEREGVAQPRPGTFLPLAGVGKLKRVRHSTGYNPVQLQGVIKMDFMKNYWELEIVPFNSI